MSEDKQMLMPWAVALTTLAAHKEHDAEREMIVDILFGKDVPAFEQISPSMLRAIAMIDTLANMHASVLRDMAKMMDLELPEVLNAIGLHVAEVTDRI